MTSSVLAALIAIGAVLYVLMSGRKFMTSIGVIALVTLGWIAGDSNTAVGGWLAGIVNWTTSAVDWIANAF